MKVRARISDLIFMVLLILWFALSIWFCWIGDGESFPRLGAGLIAIVAIFYAAMPHLSASPADHAESYKYTQLRLNQITRGTLVANHKTSELAAFVVNVFRQQNINSPEEIRTLAAIASKEVPGIEWDQSVEVIALAMDASDKEVRRSLLFRERIQAVFIFIGTLQWGFGDWVSYFASR